MSYQDSGYFRRKFPRRAFRRRVGLLVRGEYSMALSGEIGEGGMSLILPEALSEGSQLVINFKIPGGDFVSLRGEVRSAQAREEGYNHGVSFQNIAFTHKRQIRAFVSARSESESLII